MNDLLPIENSISEGLEYINLLSIEVHILTLFFTPCLLYNCYYFIKKTDSLIIPLKAKQLHAL